MELIRGLYNVQQAHRGSVATIGNFDGIHLGHQSIMNEVVAHARRLGVRSTVITFEPLPEEFFFLERAPGRLMPLCDKLIELKKLGIDQVLVLPFNSALANLEATDFVDRVLIDTLAIRHLVVGDDFRFGRKRRGDFSLLQACGQTGGFEVEDTSTLIDADARISSTRIRKALEDGDFCSAERWLGHKFTMGGRVFHGDARGRQLGFPTANIHIARRISPIHGVFAVEVIGVEPRHLPGVANIGTRPTVRGKGFQIEVHLLDFEGDLYGKRLQIRWRHKLRDEQRFDSLEDLQAQIQRDVEAARLFFETDQASD